MTTHDQDKDERTGAEAESPERAALGTIPAFARLDEDALTALADACAVEAYEPGETLFTMGQSEDALYAVLRGEARMTRADGERGDISVETVGPGGWVGLVPFALEDGSMATTALQAVGALETLAVDAHALKDLAEREAGVALGLMRLCAEAARGRKKTADPSARVYRHLLGLVRKGAGGASIPEMPRHAALAEAAGVSDVEAAGAVADLIARGIAKRAYPGLAVLDAGALHKAAFD